MIFSEKGKAKLRHIGRNPKVALNFNTDKEGGDVAVVLGKAQILNKPASANRVKTYLRKYGKGIKSLAMTIAEFTETYTIPVLVTPEAIRGFVE